MKRFIRFSILIALFAFSLSALRTPARIFDLISYTPPPGWEEESRDGLIMYNAPSDSPDRFCLITIYRSVEGSGDPDRDFSVAWQELVAKRLKAGDRPNVERGEPENGWTSLSGSAVFNFQGKKSAALLTTLSGPERALSILVVTNDQRRNDELNAFMESLKVKDAAPEIESRNAAAASSPARADAGSAFSEYRFAAPSGWSQERSANEIVLRGPDGQSVLSLLPPQASSGDLGKDMGRIFWEVFSGWSPDPADPDHHTIVRGFGPGGWEYMKEDLAIARTQGDRRLQANGFVFLAGLNGRVAVIAGSYRDGKSLLLEHFHPDWAEFFHSLSFPGFRGAVSSLAHDILGSWIVGSSSGLATYTFAANGRYSDGSGFRTSRDISAYRVQETTTTFAGSGRYTLRGNELSLIPDGGRGAETCRVRVFMEYEFNHWLKKIGLLKRSSADNSFYELTMVPST